VNRLLCACLLLLPLSLIADVTHSSPHAFTVTNSITVGKDPALIHRTLTAHLGEWWVSSHTWSGDSANLSIRLEEGGGMYESLPDGGMVEHLRLLYAAPGKEYRWAGALGPLQSMSVNGRFIWTVEPVEQGHRVVFTYHVWGFDTDGLDAIAPAVDGMMKETIGALEKRLNWK
jgi:uncharacterized protein YndB with AHSA1/START domain